MRGVACATGGGSQAACVCLFLTSALFYLPLAVLAAIIFIALKSMINIGTCVFLWKVSKLEWAQWMVAAFVTALHAYKNKHRDHPVMQLATSRLNDEEIAGLAAFFAIQQQE